MSRTKEVIVSYTDDGIGNCIGEMVGEVVRCKDCINCESNVDWQKYCSFIGELVQEEDYCCWAERKEE